MEKLKNVPDYIWYVVLGLIVILGYPLMKETLLLQTAWVMIVKSPITVNAVLLMYVWERFIYKVREGKNRRTTFIIWLVGVALWMAMVLFQKGA